jgi:Amt family ammonium transporter
MENFKTSADVLFILLGAIMILAMHAGFAFLELGTVRKKNQVNALVKILCDFSVSTLAYFFIGYSIAYGVNFFAGAETLLAKNGYDLVKFFFLLTFAAAIPAIVSGGIAERAKFNPQLAATFLLVGFVYPIFEGIAWNQAFGIQGWLKASFGEEFHDFAGSVVVHAMGGWIGLTAVILLGARKGRYHKDGGIAGALFVIMFTITQNRWKIDDVLGVWPLHGLCGAWGGIAAGIFGLQGLGGLGGVSFVSQVAGTLMGVSVALIGGFAVYGGLKKVVGIRLDAEEEYNGADLSIHQISASAERETLW